MVPNTRPFFQPSSRFAVIYQSFCSRTTTDWLHYDWIDEKNMDGYRVTKGFWWHFSSAAMRQNSHLGPKYFLQSSRIRVDLLLYKRKTTDKRERNVWRGEENLDGKPEGLTVRNWSWSRGLSDLCGKRPDSWLVFLSSKYMNTRADIFPWSSCFRVDLLSYDSKLIVRLESRFFWTG